MKVRGIRGGAKVGRKFGARGFVISVTSFALGVLPLFGYADEKDELIQKLMKRVDELEKKVEVLTNKIVLKEEKAVPEELVQKKVDEALKKKEEEAGGVVKALKDVDMSGYVDVSYTYNFGGPDSRQNSARVFDTEANNFTVHAGELVFQKAPPEEGGAGFRTDLFFGQDAEVITPFGSSRDQFDLQQAYIELKPPLRYGNWQSIKFGKFVTMHGAEVIESKDNWNFTRSLLFGYAIPFTHTGVRAGYKFSDSVTGYMGVNNGWDNVKDNNNDKSIEASVSWVANDKLSFSLAGMAGPEQTANDNSQRTLIDLVTTYKPFDKWTFMLNADYADEENALGYDSHASWKGIAGYLKYDLNERMSLANRTEFFDDMQGVRVTPGRPQDMWETTFTFEFRPYKNLITRLEYRHDESNTKIFTSSQDAVDHQDTIGLELIYPF